LGLLVTYTDAHFALHSGIDIGDLLVAPILVRCFW